MVEIYVDGASSPQKEHRCGGWGMVVIDGDENVLAEDSGGIPNTTNQVMELFAGIAAVRYVIEHDLTDCTIVSDSEYVVKGINERMANWKRNSWRTNAKKPVKNLAFWQHLYRLWNSIETKPEVKWVRGHDGNKWNEVADKLAVNAKMNVIASL